MAEVPAPLYISSRLMAALDITHDVTIHLHADHRDDEGRIVYRYIIENRLPGHGWEYEATDLRSGVGATTDYLNMMHSLLAFLAHDAEAWHEGHGETAFNSNVAWWAEAHVNALDSAIADLSDDGDFYYID